MIDLNTPVQNTWCPGCPNFIILSCAKKAISELISEGKAKQTDFVTVSGIGCHAKIYDFINTSGFYGLHGRAIPVSNGVTLGNPNLKVMTFAGDGDAYAEGISHFVQAARMNPNHALFVHDNKIFALTTGQATPTTEQGYPTKSAPKGNQFIPLNPVALALQAGASFVARESTFDIVNLTKTMKAAIEHKGFAYVDILQPCISFHNFSDYIKGRTYRIEAPLNYDEALNKAGEWDYSMKESAKIPVGILYKQERPTLDELFNIKEWHNVHKKREMQPELWERFKI